MAWLSSPAGRDERRHGDELVRVVGQRVDGVAGSQLVGRAWSPRVSTLRPRWRPLAMRSIQATE